MNPAMSVVLFTTIAGAAQGLVVTLALAQLAGLSMAAEFVGVSLLLAGAMLLIGLGASFAHLGRPERAWRAALMWRTSWLSREVILLPAFIAVVALWWWVQRSGGVTTWLCVVALLLAAALWYCTAMIYACLRFIEEWAQPLTLVNFVLIGMSSGLVLASALAAWQGQAALLAAAGPAALVFTLAAGTTRWLALRRNARLRHTSTLQSATGIRAPKLVQTSMGMSAGAFNTREFFHGRSLAALRHTRWLFLVLCFAAPAVLMVLALLDAFDPSGLWMLACAVQAPGLLAERWFFFAQAKHPQNLYYQVVS
ncbi:MAG: DmsC/YnfH family molybdoenzyme membrane anchor subunit [Rubrivivax sp.]